MTRVSRAELIQYWTLQKALSLHCERCDSNDRCWSYDGAVFHPDILFQVCPSKDVQEGFKKLLRLLEAHEPSDFVVEGKEQAELMKIVRAKLK